jgi:hypothetical protein
VIKCTLLEHCNAAATENSKPHQRSKASSNSVSAINCIRFTDLERMGPLVTDA